MLIDAGDFRFSPLENGLDFLLSSLECLTCASSEAKPGIQLSPEETWHQKRHLKYALLHLCSSIEVLFKVRLKQEHWSLVFANVNKADRDAQAEGEFESVTFHDLMDRLVRICRVDLSESHRHQLNNLRKRRNRLEHFGTVDSLPAISTAVSSMVSFIIDFVESTFQPGSLNEQRVFIDEIRHKLGSCTAFIEQRWKEIRTDVDDFHCVVECPVCQQKALKVERGLTRCRFCHYASTSEGAAMDYVYWILGRSGDESLVKICPECARNTLVTTLPDHTALCFNCGRVVGSRGLERC